MINKNVQNMDRAISGINDGATILCSGFGDAGAPVDLLEALIETDIIDLTIVSNNAGEGSYGLAALMKSGKVKKNNLLISY